MALMFGYGLDDTFGGTADGDRIYDGAGSDSLTSAGQAIAAADFIF